MVTYLRRAGAALLGLGAAATMLVSAPNAFGYGGTPPSGSSNQPAGSSDSGSSSGVAHATVKTCHIYGGASGYGITCVTPGTGDAAKTIREILGPDESLPSCFDTPLSPATMAAEYPQLPPVPGSHYYLQACLTGLDPDRPPTDQPNEQSNNSVITIVDGSPTCVNYDETHNKATPFTPDQLRGCILTLTGKQHQVVSGIQSGDGQIPNITIVEQPSTRVRTNEDVAFVDIENAANGSGTRTPELTVGEVTLYAVMDAFKIYPYGPDGVSKTCDGTQPVGVDDTRATKPNACWWTYTKSSAAEPGMTYPFRAEADWSIHYIADGVDHVLKSFQKYDDLALPVYDIQTLVIR